MYSADQEVSASCTEDDYGFFPMDDDNDEFAVDQQQTTPKKSLLTLLMEEDAATDSSNNNKNNDNIDTNINPSTIQQQQQQPNRLKPAIKYGSSYGSDEGIPLDFERTEFNRVLPKPDLSQRHSTGPQGEAIQRPSSGIGGLFRVASEPVFVHPVYQSSEGISNDDNDNNDNNDTPSEIPVLATSLPSHSSGFVEGALKKRISFGTIQIREHAQTIGDNPSCSYGTPVQLDWKHQDMEEMDFEEYENFRSKGGTRTKQQFHMNHFQRMNLLKMNGYSTNEIKDSKKKVSKSRNQRERTKFLVSNYPQVVALEDAFESGVRKFKRSISKTKLMLNDDRKSTSKDDNDLTASDKKALLEMMDKDWTI